MADDKSFKELIQEQKQTNKLLMQQMASDEKGSSLGQSIKNSAGEIINDVLIGNKQKRESDETQAVIKKTSKDGLSESAKNQKESSKVWSMIANTLTGAFLGKSKGSAAEKEKLKDKYAKEIALLKKYLGKGSFVGKRLTSLFDSFKGFAKSLYGKGKGILKVLLGAAAFGLLLKFLDSEGFKKFIESGDAGKKISAAAKAIFGKGGFLDKTVKFLTEFLPNILWGKDKGGTATKPDDFSLFGVFSMAAKSLRKNIGIAFNEEGDEPLWKRILAIFKIVLITAAPFLAIGAATAIGGLAATAIWTLSGIGFSALFTPAGAIILLAIAALLPAVKFMLDRKAKAKADDKEYDTYIGDFIAAVGGGALNVLNILMAEALDILTLGVFDFGKTARETDYRVLFADWYTDLGTFLYNTVAGALKFVKKIIFGKNKGDLESDVAKTEEKIIANLAAQDKILSNPNIKNKKVRSEDLMNQYNDLVKIKRIQEGKVSDFDPNAPRGVMPGNMTKIIGDQSLQRFKDTGNIDDFTSIEKGGKGKDATNLVKSVLADKDKSIEDLYYNKEGNLTYSPGGKPAVSVINQSSPKEVIVHKNVIQIGPPQQNMATIFGNN